MATKKRRTGRPPMEGEKVQIKFTPAQLKKMRTSYKETGRSIAQQVRDAVDKYVVGDGK